MFIPKNTPTSLISTIFVFSAITAITTLAFAAEGWLDTKIENSINLRVGKAVERLEKQVIRLETSIQTIERLLK